MEQIRTKTPQSRILVLKKVSIEQILATPIAIQRTVKTQDSIYTKIPQRFTGLKDHPNFTNLKCWYCDIVPSGYPKFIPSNLEVTRDTIACDTEGIFSHWCCVVSYCNATMREPLLSDTLQMVNLVKAHINDRDPYPTRSAISKTKRQCYCGDSGMTDSEYTKILDELDKIAPPSKLNGRSYE